MNEQATRLFGSIRGDWLNRFSFGKLARRRSPRSTARRQTLLCSPTNGCLETDHDEIHCILQRHEGD